MISRAEHLAWCKRRALEYLDAGDVRNALVSFMSDLRKHPGTHIEGIGLAGKAMGLMLDGGPIEDVRRLVESLG